MNRPEYLVLAAVAQFASLRLQPVWWLGSASVSVRCLYAHTAISNAYPTPAHRTATMARSGLWAAFSLVPCHGFRVPAIIAGMSIITSIRSHVNGFKGNEVRDGRGHVSGGKRSVRSFMRYA